MVFSVASLSGGCMRITKWKDIPVELFWLTRFGAAGVWATALVSRGRDNNGGGSLTHRVSGF